MKNTPGTTNISYLFLCLLTCLCRSIRRGQGRQMRVPRDEVRCTMHSDEMSAWGDDNSRALLDRTLPSHPDSLSRESVLAGLADIATTLEPTKRKNHLGNACCHDSTSCPNWLTDSSRQRNGARQSGRVLPLLVPLQKQRRRARHGHSCRALP